MVVVLGGCLFCLRCWVWLARDVVLSLILCCTLLLQRWLQMTDSLFSIRKKSTKQSHAVLALTKAKRRNPKGTRRSSRRSNSLTLNATFYILDPMSAGGRVAAWSLSESMSHAAELAWPRGGGVHTCILMHPHASARPRSHGTPHHQPAMQFEFPLHTHGHACSSVNRNTRRSSSRPGGLSHQRFRCF